MPRAAPHPDRTSRWGSPSGSPRGFATKCTVIGRRRQPRSVPRGMRGGRTGQPARDERSRSRPPRAAVAASRRHGGPAGGGGGAGTPEGHAGNSRRRPEREPSALTGWKPEPLPRALASDDMPDPCDSTVRLRAGYGTRSGIRREYQTEWDRGEHEDRDRRCIPCLETQRRPRDRRVSRCNPRLLLLPSSALCPTAR